MPGIRALFPLDGSEPTYRAVERGLQRLATVKDAQATFLVVLSKNLRDMPEEAVEHLKYDDEDEVFIRDDEAKAVLDKAAAIAKKFKLGKVTQKTLEGHVYDSILGETRQHDLLVMHALARDEVREKRRGGVLEKLCRNAACDVWLVRTD